MSKTWKEFDRVIVTKNGEELEGFVNIIDKKSGLIHVHTDRRGPITLMANSKAIRRADEEDDSSKSV